MNQLNQNLNVMVEAQILYLCSIMPLTRMPIGFEEWSGAQAHPFRVQSPPSEL